jgi:cytochrome c-type biogenesis protein CcmH
VTVFWLAAGALALGALSFLLVPLWRCRQESGRWSVAGVAAAALVVPLSLSLYLGVSTWDGVATGGMTAGGMTTGTEGQPAVAELVAGLAERMREQPDDVDGWRLLGQSYVSIGMYPEGLSAFREAWARTPDPDTGLKMAVAEALAYNDPTTLVGEAGQLISEVLAVEPRNEKALWWGGVAALHAGAPELVRQRWSALLEIGVPEAVEAVIREQLAALGPGFGAPPAVAEPVVPAPADGEFALTLQISLGEGVATPDFGPNAALFIFARAPEGGPPLAVIRESVDSVPGEFILSDAQAMLPGRSLADFSVLTLVARLSASGQPTAQSGDLFGELEYQSGGESGTAALVIDQLAP